MSGDGWRRCRASLLLVLLGGALVVLAFLDALWTTLWVGGSAGPISSRVAKWSWRGSLALVGHRHRALSLAGPFVLSLIIILWVAMLWLGWTLIFSGDDRSILHSSTNMPADWPARFYFVGYLLFTAGLGDYTPNGSTWQILAVLANMSGLLLATLGITYILSVISAVVQKRAFASQVSGLGRNRQRSSKAAGTAGICVTSTFRSARLRRSWRRSHSNTAPILSCNTTTQLSRRRLRPSRWRFSTTPSPLSGSASRPSTGPAGR